PAGRFLHPGRQDPHAAVVGLARLFDGRCVHADKPVDFPSRQPGKDGGTRLRHRPGVAFAHREMAAVHGGVREHPARDLGELVGGHPLAKHQHDQRSEYPDQQRDERAARSRRGLQRFKFCDMWHWKSVRGGNVVEEAQVIRGAGAKPNKEFPGIGTGNCCSLQASRSTAAPMSCTQLPPAAAVSSPSRYLPVRTSTPRSPARIAPATSFSASSPIITASSARHLSESSTAWKKSCEG